MRRRCAKPQPRSGLLGRRKSAGLFAILLTVLCTQFFIGSAFEFFLFGNNDLQEQAFISEEKVVRHPRSPAEVDPKSAIFRAKRQAYKVSVGGGSVSITTDKSSIAETGVWSSWTKVRDCSRSCGGGVLVEERQCTGECTGPSTRYLSCNLETCSTKTDYRAEQCASHNDDALDGKYFKWIPYPGKNKCELTCKPDTANFYYKWADKVIDGTSCGDNSVCVDGVCLPLGCDGLLGSTAKKDKCGVCNGNESTCKSVDGVFEERNLKAGYHDVVVLPTGATGIKIEELRSTSNSLAIKNSSGYFYLNGNYQIHLLDKDIITIAGTSFKYSKAQPDGEPEKLSAEGPLDEELTIALLFQPTTASKTSAVKYEYSIPLEDDIQYFYKPGEWSTCSVTCGKGVQMRTPYCIDALSQARVDDQLCASNNATKLDFEKPCETVHCEAEWFTGNWEDCSETCGNNGWQYRTVYCHKTLADGRQITVPNSNCTEIETRPIVKQACNRFSCPDWHAGPWSACSEKCGEAKQYRSVTCRSEKEGEEGRLLPAESCPTGIAGLESERSCNLGPCEGLHFHTSEWNLCQRCKDTQETRNVTCRDQSGRAFPLEKCLNGTVDEIPIDIRSCATQVPCIYEWHTSQWSKCNTECGHGHKNRKVHCAINELGDIQIVDESLCSAEDKPKDKEECLSEAKCTGTYFTGPWSNCSKECGGGTHSRIVVCLNYDRKPAPELCEKSTKPIESENCNIDPCPTCDNSTFGCCPDNLTFATGPFLQGCSNCTISKFGCCNDNITEATGLNAKGCLEFDEAIEGSGEGELVAAIQDSEKCEVISDSGDNFFVPCNTTIAPSTVNEVELMLNGSDGGENVTKHCSKTEFGCCADWYTPAEGLNQTGCPEIKLGACNNTKFGCCLDEVTLARGPDYQGCGEPTCAGSLYGCCKDRRTIAFGPHYAGCERSSFPCELSTFGCCPDGETAALDKNLTGCGASCLVTKFGCCPDMKTHAKGLHNEGCGCEYAQYGCCPDGKSSAQGPGFYGCPATCAQSQFGCCPDGKTPARGINKEGCPCQYTRWGCCPDGETTALGPKNDGCDDCRYAKHGCCLDGSSKAFGPNYAGCPTTTPAPFMQGGTVAPQKIISCNLPQDGGTVCGTYVTRWFYNTVEGRCAQFWYGGCGGNDNNYQSREQCEQICVEPPELGRCYLPKMEGSLDCTQLVPRYWYDYTTRQCTAFWYRGCLGNSNNFATWEECETFCSRVGPVDVATIQRQPSPSYSPYAPSSYVQPPRVAFPPAAPHVSPSSEAGKSASNQSQSPQAQQHNHIEQRRQQQQQQQDQHQQQQQQEHQRQNDIRQQSAVATVRLAPAKTADSCLQSADSGNCRQYERKWYFDVFSAKCYNFVYSGCGGNENRHASEQECLHRCAHLVKSGRNQHVGIDGSRAEVAARPTLASSLLSATTTAVATTLRRRFKTTPKSREICNLRLDIGRCEGHFYSWYYEVATGLCEQFQYSGCGGNGNRFNSKEQCENVCVRQAQTPAIGGGSGASHSGLSSFGPSTSSLDGHNIGIVGSVMHKVNKFIETAKSAAGIPSVCDLDKDSGVCSRFVPKWYYNKVDGTCTRFHYGGCDGNGNRFESEKECKSTCGDHIDACMLPQVVGPCANKISRFFYDRNTQQCLPFAYGGCFGNSNNFASVQECVTRCPVQKKYPVNVLSTHIVPPDCLQPRDIGPCRALIEAFYYDAKLSDCQIFYYGGCGGNTNRFFYREDCEQRCKGAVAGRHLPGRYPREQAAPMLVYPIENSSYYYAQPLLVEMLTGEPSLNELALDERAENDDIMEADEGEEMYTEFPNNPDALPDLCMLPEERGPCYGEYLRWRYDFEERRCTSFLYSGCQANANHFTSSDACERACGDYRNQSICEMPYDAGKCSQGSNSIAITRWFYDAGLRTCHAFMWSGCNGNGNRFANRAECEDLCSREIQIVSKSDDICSLDRDSGPCEDQLTQWYYDSNVGACRPFTYGGCRGNANRFNSKTLCQQRCRTIGYISENSAISTVTSEAVPQTASIHDEVSKRLRARIEASQPSPYLTGKSITLRCVEDTVQYRQQTPQTLSESPKYGWYWNEAELRRNEFAGEFDTTRIKFTEGGRTLRISDLKLFDSGEYSCVIGADGMLSEHYRINVLEAPPFDKCTDRGSAATCALITRTGLCATVRYGRFCCKACTMKTNINKKL